jgi:hypothetical protein
MSESTTATDWESRARAAEARVEELAAERARLWEELHRLRAERRDDAHYRDRVRYMESTASWRLTEPLREVKRVYVTVRRFLGR